MPAPPGHSAVRLQSPVAPVNFLASCRSNGAMKKLLPIFALIVFTASCSKEHFRQSPHASYHDALVRENLDASAKRWAAEANASLRSPLPITLPYSERRLLENEHLQPVTFTFNLKADQLVQVELLPSVNTRAEVFVDVFLLEDEHSEPKRIDSMPANKGMVKVSAPQDGQYLVRVQPSHTAIGLMDIAITSPVRYGFPVDVESLSPVKSFFGAGRDGGRRLHEGIDIFAPRGTAVVSATEGRVTRVGETPRGGKQVWVKGDDRSFYYAHLDSIAVERGHKVARGQVLGTVGNTGNAITTAPHLHFGIYKKWKGAIDPLPLVGRAKTEGLYALPETTLAPRWMAVSARKLNLRAGPSRQHRAAASLERGDLVRVDAIADEWLRVTTGSGQAGFVARRLTELPTESSLQLDHNHRVAYLPRADAPIISEVNAGQQLLSLGRFGDFTLVKMPSGLYGWASPSVSLLNSTAP